MVQGGWARPRPGMGAQLVSFRSRNPPDVSVFRNFETERRERLIERLIAQRNAPGEETEASICWGLEADLDRPTPATRIIIRWPDDDAPDDPPESNSVLQYNETWRQTSDHRIENPNDSEQFVVVRRIDKIRFRGPDGREHQFNLDWASNS